MPTKKDTRRAKADGKRRVTAGGGAPRKIKGLPANELDPRRIREQAAVAVLQAVPAIIQGLIDKAIDGNHLPAKFVFDFAGLSDMPASGEADAIAREISLAELLLQKLQEMGNEGGDANRPG